MSDFNHPYDPNRPAWNATEFGRYSTSRQESFGFAAKLLVWWRNLWRKP